MSKQIHSEIGSKGLQELFHQLDGEDDFKERSSMGR